jgi:PPP family 3-phenylpropionic acid transporter
MPTPLTLGLVWWLSFGGLGLIFPFYAMYLRENAGLPGSQVGLVMSMLPLAGLIGQPLWGQIADRTGRRARVFTVVAGGASLGYLVLGHAGGFGALLVATACLAIFSSSVGPSCLAVTLALLPEGPSFGRARAMGTIAFGVSAIGLPFALRAFQGAGYGAPPVLADGEQGLELIFALAAGFLALASLASLMLPSRAALWVRAQSGQWRTLLRSPAFMRIVLFTFLSFLALQGPAIMLPILVRDHGGGLDAVSRLWIPMIALEIPLVYYFGATVARLGPRGVIALGVAAAALRWAITGFGDDPAWVYGAQILHGVTVWGVVLGTAVYANDVVPAHLRSTGQGLVAMLGVSLGSVLSNMGAGWLIEVIGPRAPAQVAAVAAVGLGLAIPWLVPAPHALSATAPAERAA